MLYSRVILEEINCKLLTRHSNHPFCRDIKSADLVSAELGLYRRGETRRDRRDR